MHIHNLIKLNLFHQSPTTIAWVVMNSILTFHIVFGIVRHAFFFTYYSIIGTVVYTGHVIELNQSIMKLMGANRLTRLMPHSSRLTIQQQLDDHNRVCYLVVRGSQELFGWVLFVYLLTNLPINVYFVQRNIFTDELPPIERLFMWLVVFFVVSVVECRTGYSAISLVSEGLPLTQTIYTQIATHARR